MQPNPGKHFIAGNYFCDEVGNKNDAIPSTNWKNSFYKTSDGARVEVEITFAEKADFEKIIEMGFEAALKQALTTLMSFWRSN